MEWIKTIAPLIGVILGFALSERAKIWSVKREDKRKLKRLLFYLLELRFVFTRELNAQKDINNLYKKIEEKIKNEFGEPIESEFEIAKPIAERILKNHFSENNQTEFLEENIDSVIDDLAEVFPLLAYELSGKHNIKERLNLLDNYMNEAVQQTHLMPNDLIDWIKPKLADNLLNDLDTTIEKISYEIGKNVWSHSKEKIDTMDKRNDEDFETWLQYITNEIKQNFPKIN